MIKKNFYIAEADVAEINKNAWSQELEQERKSALFDLLNNSSFKIIKENTGPYKVLFKLLEWKLFLTIFDYYSREEYEYKFSISGIRRTIRDYQIVCENYVEAIKTAPIKKIEAIDVGRRTIHDEGATMLKDLLGEKLEISIDTSRRIFTLISIISVKI